MPHLLAAPDKFRSTAGARAVAEAACRAARSLGWSAEPLPLSDGGDGLLDVIGGEPRWTSVQAPVGDRVVEAEWRYLPDAPGGATAVIEMATAAGLSLVQSTASAATGVVERAAVMAATTAGVGDLILAARAAGARRIVVGCGGSGTTDGGRGAVEMLGSARALGDVELVAAVDVRTRFADAARRFGPQKGADADQVRRLTARLDRLADRYRDELGVEVRTLAGAGAAGGLAGGLAALGARLVPGFDLVAELIGLDAALARADVVMTGEGRLDASSLEGKVVGSLIERAAHDRPVLCVVGSIDPELDVGRRPDTLVCLEDLAGPRAARHETLSLVERAVRDSLGSSGVGGPTDRPR
ncbi:MAG TPA: glycerate kinase [Acidimicrobiales bacterium]